MYRGFNLTNHSVDTGGFRYFRLGESAYKTNQEAVRSALDSLVSSEGKIDGSKLRDNWFPQINADVFISHSHKDEKEAKIIAGWMKNEFDLDCFIDSCVWGYADELLKELDNKYCLNSDKETYSYKKRNGSTSHVHMMLSTALGMMIDHAECVLFLNTPNSISSKESVSKTQSPWLYSELAMVNIVRKKTPQRFVQETIRHRTLDSVRADALKIEYPADTSSLYNISNETLSEWQEKYSSTSYVHPLDALYDICC